MNGAKMEQDAAYQRLLDRADKYIDEEVDWLLLAHDATRQRHLRICLIQFALTENSLVVDSVSNVLGEII